MMYRHFALIYDELMANAPYDKWVDFVQQSCHRYNVSRKKVLELGCGTGTLTALLSQAHFEMTGVDVSAEMLAIAREKAKHARFFEQNMTELDVGEQFDIVLIFCDSLNYLTSEADVIATFERVYDHLTSDGLLLFDVHSLYKVHSIFKDQTFAYESDSISYIWDCYVDSNNYVEHELTFFVKREDSLYERFDELHVQKTFSSHTYEQMLSKTGFTLLDIFADFQCTVPTETSKRIFFAARKN
ncbi:class I SAM-dependent DNA methyltransferase [Pueribacillus sp. YX66]|uniref:class I SAM-dependent DNA methyltransferase n=1 Tax=Pueribacillus sp. YX66 TaxID=3229242 RepID=UPI00358D4A8F